MSHRPCHVGASPRDAGERLTASWATCRVDATRVGTGRAQGTPGEAVSASFSPDGKWCSRPRDNTARVGAQTGKNWYRSTPPCLRPWGRGWCRGDGSETRPPGCGAGTSREEVLHLGTSRASGVRRTWKCTMGRPPGPLRVADGPNSSGSRHQRGPVGVVQRDGSGCSRPRWTTPLGVGRPTGELVVLKAPITVQSASFSADGSASRLLDAVPGCGTRRPPSWHC